MDASVSGDAGVRAWAFRLATGPRRNISHDGYADDAPRSYQWDSKVANSDGPSVGDVIVLWSEHGSLGYSRIDTIDRDNGTKTGYRCPNCHRAKIFYRASKRPVYRCQDCKREFNDPEVIAQEVTIYRAHYGKGWTALSSLAPDQVRRLALERKSINSIRELDMTALRAAVRHPRF
ncbi:hypothetical protein GCM10022286_22090 [Gryllotalpicola daejeonensis]|uniref:IS1 family transposase n=1 Tax=Gryllotalpicola daejeonensis TaxID=993087 RepID=A0ABP7ZL81_9MICO